MEDVNAKYDKFLPAAIDRFLMDVREELVFATNKYPVHPSLEHSMYTLKEEVKELDDELHAQYDQRSTEAIHTEAIQVAAMAVRLLSDSLFWRQQGKVYGTVHK